MQFQLRTWHMDDLDSLVRFANNPKIAENLTNQFPHPYTREHGKSFIELATKDTLTRIFAIQVGRDAVGGIGLHPQTDIHLKNMELGYWLAEPFWGAGIMTKAVKQVVRYGFEHFDVNRIFARPFGTNTGSQKVLEKAGFVLEGKFEKTLFKNGVYLDELIYAVRRTN